MARSKIIRKLSAANIKNTNEYHQLPFAEQLRFEKSRKAVSLMRKGLSRTSAAREAGISSSALQKIVGKAIFKEGSRYKVSKSDRLLRPLVLPSSGGGKIELATRSSRTATLISKYDNALKAFVYKDDTDGVAQFKGKHITVNGRKFEFLTDLGELRRLRRAGALSFESIYAGVR